MATTRLRKAFRYPDESDDEPVDGIDEEEQERLITELHSEDAARSGFYRKAFVSLPALSLVLYLRPLFAPSSFSEFQTAAMAATSLLASAYILYFVPLRSSGGGAGKTLGIMSDEDGPIGRYITMLNMGLCALVCLSSWAARTKVSEWEGYLPGLVLGLVFLVRSQLAPVDVAGLERLRYGYKGA